jgi:hypothetical protein
LQNVDDVGHAGSFPHAETIEEVAPGPESFAEVMPMAPEGILRPEAVAPDYIRTVIEKDACFVGEPIKGRVVSMTGEKVPHVALYRRPGVTAVE